MEYKINTLRNGIIVAHLPYKSAVGYCGITLKCGSSDEMIYEFGMAHFLEHMMFKGTVKRTTSAIINRLEDVGGEINAFTTKEETTYYATFPKEYLSRASELIQDLVFNATFPATELSKEKDVVIDEINSYNDSPSE